MKEYLNVELFRIAYVNLQLSGFHQLFPYLEIEYT